MATFYLLPSAVDYVRTINSNTIDNLLVSQPSYAALPSLYQRAYMLVHQTGLVRAQSDFSAPTQEELQPAVPLTVDPRRF